MARSPHSFGFKNTIPALLDVVQWQRDANQGLSLAYAMNKLIQWLHVPFDMVFGALLLLGPRFPLSSAQDLISLRYRHGEMGKERGGECLAVPAASSGTGLGLTPLQHKELPLSKNEHEHPLVASLKQASCNKTLYCTRISAEFKGWELEEPLPQILDNGF